MKFWRRIFFVFCFIFCLFLFASSRLPLTWDEGEVSKRADELPAKWSGTINNEGHPQLPIILAAMGKNFLPRIPMPVWAIGFAPEQPLRDATLACSATGTSKQLERELFSKKFKLRFASIFFVSISFTVLFYRLWVEFDGLVACFSVISVFLIPRLFALLQIAGWDSCLIAAWICCLATFPDSLNSKKQTALFGFCLGLAFSSKFSALAIPIAFIFWAIIVFLPDKSLRKTVLVKHLFIVTIISATVFLLLNPPLWSNPIGGVSRFLHLNFHREINIPIMFLGQLYDAHHSLPYYNTIFWTIITIPTGLLFFFFVGCWTMLFSKISKSVRAVNFALEQPLRDVTLACPASGISKQLEHKCNKNCERIFNNRRFGLLLSFNMIILLFIRALPNMPVHDGVRLFAGSYVFLGIFAGFGAAAIWRAKNLLPKIMAITIFTISLFNVFWYAPQWLSFYNFAVGGLSGAVKIGMEPTYYWDGFDQEVIDWLNTNTGKYELISFSKFSPDTFSIYREDGKLLPEFFASYETDLDKNIPTPVEPIGFAPEQPLHDAALACSAFKQLEYKITVADKIKRIRYYVTQNRSGHQSNNDKYFKNHAKPVYTKTIRKGGVGAWNLGTTPIIEIYDVKNQHADDADAEDIP
ncbi:MAG: hypothetical protein LBJ00_03385 [Planctomycetaceae bacterium]|jgi:hypothetical protein|nr:hypothetical protein [Planctomycetaceae bacterium]